MAALPQAKIPDYVVEARPKFPHAVLELEELEAKGWGFLKKSSNVKVGSTITKGRYKGRRIYTATMPERSTCPAPINGRGGCHMWESCYGSNMPFASRISGRGADLIAHLERQIPKLLAERRNIGADGVGRLAVRLHILGDVMPDGPDDDATYVRGWLELAKRHPGQLMIFGFTAVAPSSRHGRVVQRLNALPDCWIRFSSNRAYGGDPNVTYAAREDFTGEAFDCPEQNGALAADGSKLECGSCTACFATTTAGKRVGTRTVRFRTH